VKFVERAVLVNGVPVRSALFITLESLLEGPFGWSRIRRDDICAADARFAGLSGEAMSRLRGAGGVRPTSVVCRLEDRESPDAAAGSCAGCSERHDEKRKPEKNPDLLGVDSIFSDVQLI
jgi:hypothetical protein